MASSHRLVAQGATMSTDNLQEKQIFNGGPCSTSAANVLHTCNRVQGATQIVEVAVLLSLADLGLVQTQALPSEHPFDGMSLSALVKLTLLM